jgi:hypothetical protein
LVIIKPITHTRAINSPSSSWPNAVPHASVHAGWRLAAAAATGAAAWCELRGGGRGGGLALHVRRSDVAREFTTVQRGNISPELPPRRRLRVRYPCGFKALTRRPAADRMQMQQTSRPLHPTQRRRLGHLVNHTRAAAADVEAAEAKVIRPRDSGWVAPAKPMESIGTPGIDFNRSFVTFTIDQSVKPAATMSDAPPFDLNNARIPIDCVLTITERSSGRAEVFHLGSNCKTETVGVPRDHGIWMAPNADFVPIFTARQALILKSYDRIGRAVQFSAASGTRAGGSVL